MLWVSLIFSRRTAFQERENTSTVDFSYTVAGVVEGGHKATTNGLSWIATTMEEHYSTGNNYPVTVLCCTDCTFEGLTQYIFIHCFKEQRLKFCSIQLK